MMGIYMFGWSYSNLAAVILSKFMSVPKESVNNAVASMQIYREGFFYIMIFCFRNTIGKGFGKRKW
jgi:hypothetical protein